MAKYGTNLDSVTGRLLGLSPASNIGGVFGVVLVKPGSKQDYPTIGAALAAASAGDVVLVGPGTYAESFTVPAGVGVYGSTDDTSWISGAAATGTRVTLAGASSRIYGLSVTLPTDATPAIQSNALAGELTHACDLTLRGNGAAGIGIQNAGAGEFHAHCVRYRGGVCDTIFDMTAGEFSVNNVEILGGTITRVFRGSGNAAGFIDGLSLDLIATVGTFLELGACTVRSRGLLADSPLLTYAIHITSSDASLEMISSRIDAATLDLLVDGGLVLNGYFDVAFCEMKVSKMSGPAAWLCSERFNLFVQDDTPNDVGFRSYGELAVGRPEYGRETVMGEGDSYTRGMVVLTTDNTAGPAADGGNLTDVSVAAASPTGSTFTFQGTGLNYSILWGSSLENLAGTIKYWGLKMKQTTAAVLITSPSFTWEIWDGAAWVAFNVMATDADAPYAPYANNVFLRANSDEQIRFGLTDSTTWARKAINGSTLYWARCRITAAVTTAPVFEQSKLHSSRVEINADGFGERMGLARRKQQLVFHQRTSDTLTGGGAPGNASILFAAALAPLGALTLALRTNSLADNQLEGLGGIVEVPEWVDTSLPFDLEIGWIPSVNGAPSQVELQANFAIVKEGDTLNGTLPVSQVNVLNTVGVADLDVLRVSHLEGSPSSAVSGVDNIAFAYYRDATPANVHDTLGGAVEIVFVRLKAYTWQI